MERAGAATGREGSAERPRGSYGDGGPSRPVPTERRRILVALLTLAVVAVLIVATISLLPLNRSPAGKPGVLSVLPASSDAAAGVADGLANNTTGGPWSLNLEEGWDNTQGLAQIPLFSGFVGNSTCPLRNSSISRYGVLGSNGSYSTGLAEGWLVEFASPTGGGANLFVWVGDGTAYEVGELTGRPCLAFGVFTHTGVAYTSEGAASAALSAANFSRYASTYPRSNATYTLIWALMGDPATAIPLWTIDLYSCNGTIPEDSLTQLYGSNGTVRSSTYGPGPPATCGSSDTAGNGPLVRAGGSPFGTARSDAASSASPPFAAKSMAATRGHPFG